MCRLPANVRGFRVSAHAAQIYGSLLNVNRLESMAQTHFQQNYRQQLWPTKMAHRVVQFTLSFPETSPVAVRTIGFLTFLTAMTFVLAASLQRPRFDVPHYYLLFHFENNDDSNWTYTAPNGE